MSPREVTEIKPTLVTGFSFLANCMKVKPGESAKAQIKSFDARHNPVFVSAKMLAFEEGMIL